MSHKLRALVIDVKKRYMNYSWEMLNHAIDEAYDTTFYGPGHTEHDHMDESLQTIVDKLGPFDVIFIHKFMYEYSIGKVEPFVSLQKKIFCYGNLKKFADDYPKFGHDLAELEAPVVMIDFIDHYNFPEEVKKTHEAFPGYIMTWPVDVVCPLAEQDRILEESFGQRSTDNFLNFCHENKERILPLAFEVLSDDEFFSDRAIQDRKYLVSVPGSKYLLRREILKFLSDKNVPALRYQPTYQIIRKISHKLVDRAFKKYNVGIKLARYFFFDLLRQSKIVFTDGSRVKMALTKFIEIPASGALMVCDPFYNASAMGFHNGVNYIDYESPEKLLDIIKKVEQEPEWAQGIIDNAYQHVKEHFTVPVFAKYLQEVAPRLIDGSYQGGHWYNGKFVMEPAVEN